jgi:hypothetical protein
MPNKLPYNFHPTIPLTFSNAGYTPLDVSQFIDMFGRVSVANPETIFDSKQIKNNQNLFWDEKQISGSATSGAYDINTSSSTLYVGNLSGGHRVRQTFRAFNYQPGKAQKILMTGILGNPTAGITKRLGYFDTNNGIFFQSANGTISVGIRSNTSGEPVDNVVNQANWNINTGSGLDFGKCQIFVIEFEWLGVGSVRVGVVINGLYTWLHQFNHANAVTNVYMATSNLPCRYEIINDGTGAVDSIKHICASVSSEGGVQRNGFVMSIDRGSVPLITLNDDATYPLLSLRLTSGRQGTEIDIQDLSAICTSNGVYRWALYWNPTLSGVNPEFSGVPNSSVQYSTPTNTTKIISGIMIANGYAQNTSEGSVSSPVDSRISLGFGITGNPDVLTLGVQRLGNQAETFYGALTWQETI